jgi:hypothetical protein
VNRFYRYDVRTNDGPAAYLAVLPPDIVEAIGLPNDAIVGVVGSRDGIFAPNAAFFDVLHGVVARDGPVEAGLRAEANRVGRGWLYVVDQRTLAPGGPVPPEDVVGYFAVEDGRTLPGSYTPNPRHQFVTRQGPFRLPGQLHARLVEAICDRACAHGDVAQTRLGQDPQQGRYADVRIDCCRTCRLEWLHYQFEVEAFSRSGRWYRGRLPAGMRGTIDATNAARILEALPDYVAGGSWFAGQALVRSGPLL